MIQEILPKSNSSSTTKCTNNLSPYTLKLCLFSDVPFAGWQFASVQISSFLDANELLRIYSYLYPARLSYSYCSIFSYYVPYSIFQLLDNLFWILIFVPIFYLNSKLFKFSHPTIHPFSNSHYHPYFPHFSPQFSSKPILVKF